MIDQLMNWVGTLPPSALYAIGAFLGAFENIFPPFPSDVFIAFTVFVEARTGAPLMASAMSVWAGSVGGSMLMFFVGRRYGSLLLLEKLEHFAGKRAGERLQALHAQYGIFALFISRFIPGVRAVVPPFAGAMKLPAWQVFVSMSLASGIWYWAVAYIAYQAGENWEVVARNIGTATKWAGLVALVLVAGWALSSYIRSRRTSGSDAT